MSSPTAYDEKPTTYDRNFWYFDSLRFLSYSDTIKKYNEHKLKSNTDAYKYLIKCMDSAMYPPDWFMIRHDLKIPKEIVYLTKVKNIIESQNKNFIIVMDRVIDHFLEMYEAYYVNDDKNTSLFSLTLKFIIENDIC